MFEHSDHFFVFDICKVLLYLCRGTTHTAATAITQATLSYSLLRCLLCPYVRACVCACRCVCVFVRECMFISV